MLYTLVMLLARVLASARSPLARGCYYRRIMSALTITASIRRLVWWQWLWLLLAATSLPPVSYSAYQALQSAARDLKVQLIRRYNLWETDPQYRGSPQAWTRFAAMLLNTSQLMERVRQKQGATTDQIEDDFGRDSALAYSKVIAFYLSIWGLPLALLYGAGWFYQRRKSRVAARRTSNS